MSPHAKHFVPRKWSRLGEPLGSAALLEELPHWGWAFRGHSLNPQLFSLFPVSDSLLVPAEMLCLFVVMTPQFLGPSLWNHKPKYTLPSMRCLWSWCFVIATEKGPVQILPQITHCTYTSCLNIVQPYKQLRKHIGQVFLFVFCF